MKTQRFLLLLVLTAVLPALAQDSSGVRSVGSISNQDWRAALAVAVQNNYAYIGTGATGLSVIDASDPTHPYQVGCWESHFCVDVAVIGGYAYVASDSGLRILDVSDPTQPHEVGFWESYVADAVAVDGNYAYGGGSESPFSIADVSDPSRPVEVGSYYTGGLGDIAIVGSYAFLAVYKGGLVVMDISDPTHPSQVGIWGAYNAAGVTVVGNYAYLTCGSDGLYVVDVSDPTQPQVVGQYDTPGHALSIAVIGGYVCVADYSDGLRVVDVSDPTEPFEVGYYDTPGNTANVTVGVDGLVYVADYYSLGIYDCSEAMSAPTDPATNHPMSFCLNPAFPNPFNSTTTIAYALPRPGRFALDVVDLNGQIVTRLSDGWKQAGSYRDVWNANGLASGVYMVRLKSNSESISNKTILVR